MPFTFTINVELPIVTVSVQGFAREPSMSLEVNLDSALLPREVADALESARLSRASFDWDRAFFAVLGPRDRHGPGLCEMECVVAIDKMPFLKMKVDIAAQTAELRVVPEDSAGIIVVEAAFFCQRVDSPEGAQPGDEVGILYWAQHLGKFTLAPRSNSVSKRLRY
jgi:hypothetical protein